VYLKDILRMRFRFLRSG